jgi:hypothetical protein
LSIVTILLILSLGLILTVLFFMLRGYFLRGKPRAIKTGREGSDDKKKLPCILCGSQLARGERIHSTVFKGEGDSIVHVYGCPHCYGELATEMRICPICRGYLPDGGYLMGRMWDRKQGKRHLHVSGCTLCKPGGMRK